ncbi:DNA-binding beta-propeller fold protein YncE [Enhydrobacter aerosaccus]|uniref:DNA-binding beta-propeller fold protein YncE n=1 Tax=Enhydrobacter aerosaccus TaxID=225324 RepID=A0A1T4MSB8_9HYPH|nr:PQQ-binding-like beta-propeller repeat protein [Enhydrobacter aerosaccus]SJZ69892.1 DNA-binding beta-propeller fold protein YncE [Enhydrobacter aerosaccus]
MKKFAFALLALSASVTTAQAESIIVLNSEDASYSILDRATRMEVQRLPLGREPHHLILTPNGKEVLLASTFTNELVALDTRTLERRYVVRDIIDPYQLGFSPDGKWMVTAANRLDHVDIYQTDGYKLAGRIFLDSIPSHIAFDAASRTTFVTLQESGRVAALDLATQTIKWNVEVGKAPAGIVMLPDDKRLLVALTGEESVLTVDPKDGSVIGRLPTGKAAHNFRVKDNRYYFLSNRVGSTVSLIDTQEMKVVASIKVPGGPDDMDITPDGKELWVTQRFLRRIAIIDIAEMKMIGSVRVGKSPHGLIILKTDPAAVPNKLRSASIEPSPK